MAAAFANYLVPLQIGARDVAFPRLNSFGFWAFFFGGVFLNLSWFMGGAPDGGWFAYAPNTGVAFSPTHGMDFWVLALQITGLASLTGAINLIVTILNMRAPGMSLMRMPVFTWMILVTQFLLVFAIPVITVALVLLNFERLFGGHVLRRAGRRGPTPVAAPVLDLRAPGGLHPDLAQLRHRVRGAPGLQPQSRSFGYPVRGVLRRGDRLHGLGRLGAPHVRLRASARSRSPCSRSRRCSSPCRPA
jgi:cytochrome c oxidase subunit 1